MKKIVVLCVALLAMIASTEVYGQCCNGSCYRPFRQTRVYRPYSYRENCTTCQSGYCNSGFNSCNSGYCSQGNCTEAVQSDEAELKTMELHKTEEVSEEYKPESDGLLYAKCVKCGASLGFRVLESDKHSCPRCKAWYRYFDEKLWYEVPTEKRLTKVPVTDTIQLQVFEEINKMRTNRGLRPCEYDESFEWGAQNHSNNMARRHSCDHNDPLNGCAEICASWQTSPLAAVTAWLYSRGHAAIMLSSRFTRCAVGVATDNYGRKYWTARFK